ncbi:BnaC05g49980D [Brassica napus]|uniref:BnaC05g49980D protein n=1 Tax=Brassica napus TaxID=3708 RepID=A0A078J1P1_BRANA|nr:BnaC05g49980D [Brassica napus]
MYGLICISFLFSFYYAWHVNALHTLLPCCSISETKIVALVKNRTSDMTVAIGDGNETSANDVSMIQMDDKIQILAKEKGHKKNPKIVAKKKKIQENTVKQGIKYHLKLYVANLLMYLEHNMNLTQIDILTDTRLPYLNLPTA